MAKQQCKCTQILKKKPQGKLFKQSIKHKQNLMRTIDCFKLQHSTNTINVKVITQEVEQQSTT